jgi:2-C-methyl-D-erythritol 4-phosphate cytidylyltransferase
LGAGTPKALVSLRGRPLLEHALTTIAEAGVADAVVVVYPEPARSRFESLLEDLPPPLRASALVRGGQTRQESVRLGLEAVGGSADVVLCHDAARPLATAELFRRVEEGLRQVEGSIPMIPSPDTVKLVEAGKVIQTLPRAQVGLAQTPQAFLVPVLLEAHGRALRQGMVGTDDAMLVEAAGYTVAVVEGEIQNFKITTPEDVRRAEQILSERGEGILQ